MSEVEVSRPTLILMALTAIEIGVPISRRTEEGLKKTQSYVWQTDLNQQ